MIQKNHRINQREHNSIEERLLLHLHPFLTLLTPCTYQTYTGSRRKPTYDTGQLNDILQAYMLKDSRIVTPNIKFYYRQHTTHALLAVKPTDRRYPLVIALDRFSSK